MQQTQIEKLYDFMSNRSVARTRDLTAAGVSATTIARAVQDGKLMKVARGLYQLPNADIGPHAALVEIAARAPGAVICLTSALAFHGLTDQLPRKVWIAIGPKSWKPTITYPQIRAVRFRDPYLSGDVETHMIDGVKVRMYSVTKSLADAFRNPKLVDRSVAIECLRNTLEQRVATPSQIAASAKTYGAWNQIRPYLEALTSNG